MKYVDKVDIISYEKKSKRAFEQLKDICAILSGLLVASGKWILSRAIFYNI
jgi:hypothetical protein